MTHSNQNFAALLAAFAIAMTAGCAIQSRKAARDAMLEQYIASTDDSIHRSLHDMARAQAERLRREGRSSTQIASRTVPPRSENAPTSAEAFQRASYQDDPHNTGRTSLGPPPEQSPPQRSADATTTFPIDLANALAMGGANHLQIQLARQRVVEAHANLLQARAMWLPSLRFGVGWNKHDGRLQETEGNVLEISRHSLFVGGGAGLGNAPIAGGASGPTSLLVNLSLADAVFSGWVAERKLAAQNAAEHVVINDSLGEIAVAFFNLVEDHGRLANAGEGLRLSSEMVKLTVLFAREGAGSEAAVDLARTEEAVWSQAVQDAQRRTIARSAELVRLLRMNPRTTLTPADENVVPVHLIDPQTPLDELLAAGMSSRPELAQQQALVEAAKARIQQEQWRPWLPSVHVAASAGTFGGGPSSDFDNQSGRSDVDLLAVWEMQNLGLGIAAQRRVRASQLYSTEYEAQWIRDQVSAEIVTANGDINSYLRQMETAMQSVVAAGQSYTRNFERVRNGEGLPIELLQAIRARANALDAYTQAVGSYNRAQVRLLRAIGRPPPSVQY